MYGTKKRPGTNTAGSYCEIMMENYIEESKAQARLD